MKRIISTILLITILSLCLCSCGSTDSELKDYVTNYDAFVECLKKDFEKDNIDIRDADKQPERARIKNEGGVNWYMYVEDVYVVVYCHNYIISGYMYEGHSFDVRYQPSPTPKPAESQINNDTSSHQDGETHKLV